MSAFCHLLEDAVEAMVIFGFGQKLLEEYTDGFLEG